VQDSLGNTAHDFRFRGFQGGQRSRLVALGNGFLDLAE